MKIAILSRHASTRSTLRLVEAGAERGHEVVVVDYLRCYMRIAAHRHELFYQGAPLTDVNAIVPRIAAKYTFYGCAVVRQFEMMGVYSVNGSQAIARSRDKLRALQLLSRKGLGMPVTGIAHATDDVEGLMAEVGGAPMVVKLIEGMQGIGVVLTETHQAAKSVIEAFRSLEANILAQEFIAEAGGADLRCFVVGDRVIAAVKRQGPPGEFRSNIHRGGQASIVKLTREERQTAVRAVQATGLRVAGVDILRAKRGPLVMEVNSSPGLAGFEDTAQVDVAGAIIEHAVKHAAEGVSRDRVQG